MTDEKIRYRGYEIIVGKTNSGYLFVKFQKEGAKNEVGGIVGGEKDLSIKKCKEHIDGILRMRGYEEEKMEADE